LNNFASNFNQTREHAPLTKKKDMIGKLSSIGIIPARYGSTRFPGKPLEMIGNKSMIQRVYERSKLSKLDKVIVATDDVRIFDHVIGFGGEVIMTASNIGSGTERCAAALENIEGEFDIVLNIQGDEPFINPALINELLLLFNKYTTQIATPCKIISKDADLMNPNIVKVVINNAKFALYFSRSPIPFIRDLSSKNQVSQHQFLAHIGIYAFRTDILEEIVKLSEHPLEKAESLEQLRWLANGYTIRLFKTSYQTISVDSPEDLIKINKNLEKLELL
jgi:3-deoxy-manno-octulosonate cytidylyltransferase (CMP-KDO synthetase)